MVLAVILLTATQAWTANVDETMARAKAEQFLKNMTATGKMMTSVPASLRLVHTESSSVTPTAVVYYIFNTVNGFVIVSGEDRAQEILAYGDHAIDMSALPENMKYWLSYYKRQLEFLQANPDVRVTVPVLNAPQRAAQSVNPLITANWSQNKPYWNECPTYGIDTCYTGCPATSLSMVFHYWKYPRQQTPTVPSFLTPSYGVVLPELPPTVFDWGNMLDNYVDGNYTDVQATAVAHLMRYIGQAEEMDYTISGSGAYLQDVLRAVKFFEYDQNAQMLFKSDELGYENYSDTQWAMYIQNELVAGRPIVYCAYDNYTGSGHAFNVDGYDAITDTYHINWGWNGRGNGHFALNAFSYQDYTFGTAQQMVIGIQPPADYQNTRLQAYPKNIDMMAYPGKPSTTTFDLKGTNLTADVNLALNDPDQVFAISATSLPRDVAELGQTITVSFSPQAVGQYTATIVCTSDGTEPLTISLVGNAPLEVYPPVMKPADQNDLTLTSLRAQWTDETPVSNVESYTLEVYSQPSSMLLEVADFSDLPQMAPTNQASHAADYLPDGWSFTGSEFNLEGGCVMPRRNGVITTDALQLKGYDKVTVIVTGRSYSSWGDPSELTISTSLASQEILLPFSYAPTIVLLDCVDGDRISFTAGYYPMIQKIEIYAGDATDGQPVTEDSDEFYRLIEGIAPSVRTYTVRNLAAGGSFFYQVKARYINGTESNWSEVEQVTLADGEHTYSIGDINHDSIVNITDVTALINMLLTEGDICTICADCYPDGKINISDVTALIHYLLSHQW